VHPNTLGSTVTSQGFSSKMSKLLCSYFAHFFQIFSILGNRIAYRASATSAITSFFLPTKNKNKINKN